MANIFTRTADNATKGIADWVNARAPGMMPMYRKHMTEYYAPTNFNFWYYFGSIALLVLVKQILTGIFLTMHFKPLAAEAVGLVEYIMSTVQLGWVMRDIHSTAPSRFFLLV